MFVTHVCHPRLFFGFVKGPDLQLVAVGTGAPLRMQRLFLGDWCYLETVGYFKVQ